LKKYSDAKVHAQALRELSDSFKSEVQPQVVDVEGRTLRLTGTAEEQYREWRKMLHQLYLEENGAVTAAELGAPRPAGDATPAPSVPLSAAPAPAGQATPAPAGQAAPAPAGQSAPKPATGDPTPATTASPATQQLVTLEPAH
jgi:hypothetical protein